MRGKRTRSVAEEFSGAEFGDRRLGARLEVMAEAFSASPGASLPNAMRDEAELEGAYRFLGNPKVTADKILAPHIAATRERVRAVDLAYCISDTTELRYGGHRRRGLGPLQNAGQGFLEHVAIAVAADGSRLPLGVLAHKTIIRPLEPKKRRGTKRSRRAPDSESRKWEQVAESAEHAIEQENKLIHLMDREADIYALLASHQANKRRFVIRLGQNRKVVDDEGIEHLFDALDSATERSRRDVEICARPRNAGGHPKREPRLAHLTFAARPVVVCRAKSAVPALPQQRAVNVVHVREVEPPAGEEPVDWKLVTSEPIESATDLERVVDAYRHRWVIEEFFKALKTGCDVESNQLESLAPIRNLLAIMMPIAIQLLALRSLATTAPAAPAARVLSSHELDALRLMSRKKVPRHLTVSDAMYAIAAMGGHIKNNGPPGWQVLARGYLDLIRYAEVLQTLQNAKKL